MMPSVIQLRERLLIKLKQLFQLDQPDLDFGFYRIMHAKSQQVSEFIEQDLFKIVQDAFGQVDDTRTAAAKAAYEKSIETAKQFGAPDPASTPAVKEAKAKYEAIKDTTSSEADIYEHLYRFFERYYNAGDFISRRYYTRETPGKAAPFAIPYNGEEVKLHWANADQYYIKTTEYFSTFTFDLRQAKEVRASGEGIFQSKANEHSPLKVHFRIIDATEGDHGNIRAGNDQKRFFLIHKVKPIELNTEGEVVVNFQYRSDPEKSGQENAWRDRRNAEAVETVLTALAELSANDKTLEEYQRVFKLPAPTESNKNRSLLAKYINQYTARNTMDYFIHKDLGGFLRRELDFYIKNEIMRLDDIENADVPAVESYLAKIKILRKIACKLIDFLAQLEDFQKKLWLKKKFVLETNYCITLDRVPDELYPEIATNESQHDEWVKLFAIDEIEQDLINPGYTKPLTVDFLKANDKLVLDTRFFDDGFKAKLISSIENLDEQCDGLLIHSENFQALNIINKVYHQQINSIFLDPPYNTGIDGFPYKDTYKHSSWLTMVKNRLTKAYPLMALNGLHFIIIDFVEVSNLRLLCDTVFGADKFLADIAWEKRYTRSNNAKLFYSLKDTILCYRASDEVSLLREDRSDKSKNNYTNPDKDPRGPWISSSYVNPATKDQRPNLVYSIRNPITEMVVKHSSHAWKYDLNTHHRHVSENRLYWGPDGSYEYPRLKTFLSEASDGMVPIDVWHYKDTGTTDDGGKILKSLFGKEVFKNPKPPSLIQRAITLSVTESSIVLDHFAGSGTTGHAVINLNREDDGNRKYILVEMGDYFDTVLKPRIAKVVYSDSWKDGKPTSRGTGISHCFKYMRLESYEDTLNNLRFDENTVRDRVIANNNALREDYMLHYMLDVETKGSQSLLNIDAFVDPTAYKLKVKRPGSDEYVVQNVDLLETFNYLIGLRVEKISGSQEFNAAFKRVEDREVPTDQKTKLVLDGNMRETVPGDAGWWFRTVEGWIPKDPLNPNNGQREKVMVVWRKLTGDLEKDNVMLDEWFRKSEISDRKFDTIYVNGSNNLQNIARTEDRWKVILTEEEFMKRMWDAH
jgi:adenine-specific DNA-methyltransferase